MLLFLRQNCSLINRRLNLKNAFEVQVVIIFKSTKYSSETRSINGLSLGLNPALHALQIWWKKSLTVSKTWSFSLRVVLLARPVDRHRPRARVLFGVMWHVSGCCVTRLNSSGVVRPHSASAAYQSRDWPTAAIIILTTTSKQYNKLTSRMLRRCHPDLCGLNVPVYSRPNKL